MRSFHASRAIFIVSYIIGRYISILVLKSAFFALALLLTLFSILGLVETLEEVGKGTFTTFNAVSVMILEIPNRIIELLPISTLMGSVMGLGVLANNHEASAMRASGLAVKSFSKIIILISLAIAIAAFVAQNYAVPIAEKQVQRIKAYAVDQTDYSADGFWSKKNNHLIRIESLTRNSLAKSIEIYELSDSGKIARIITAENARIQANGLWELIGVVDRNLRLEEKRSKKIIPSLMWQSFLSADQLDALVTPPHALSTYDLLNYMNANQKDGVSTRSYEIIFWQRMMLPITLVAMGMIGLPIALSSVQSRSTGVRSLVAGGIGISFYLFQQITGHLATLLELSALVSVVIPPIIILCLALHYAKKI